MFWSRARALDRSERIRTGNGKLFEWWKARDRIAGAAQRAATSPRTSSSAAWRELSKSPGPPV
jgi:hypothetical protein